MESKQRKRKKLGSYPYVSVVFSIFLSLVVVGLFGLIFIHATQLTAVIKENIEVQIYLEKGITANQRVQVQKTLSASEFVATKNDELQIRFISKEQAAEKFMEDTGEDFTTFLGDNPLRDAFVINIAEESQSPDRLKEIQAEIEKISGVFEVVYVESVVEAISKNLAIISLVLIIFIVALIIISVLVINGTIKLALFSQRFLIRSMQLVGAKSSFIQRPFLIRSIVNGLLAGVLACGAVYGVLNLLLKYIEDLKKIQSTDYIILLMILLLVLGGIVSLVSTYWAIRKYLRLSLDELY